MSLHGLLDVVVKDAALAEAVKAASLDRKSVV